MIVSIHQPNYIPWIGYFDKVSQSDVHVFLDDVEYSKNGYTNRNKILMNSNETYLTIPIPKKYYNSNISDIMISDPKWKNKHLKTLKQAYSKAGYVKQYMPELEDIIVRNNNLSCLNTEIIVWLCNNLNISTEFVFSSDIENNKDFSKTELLVDLCTVLKASKYISGLGARNYLQTGKFAIDVAWQDFTHPKYKQNSSVFVENMSVLDLLFNEGPASERFFKN